MITGIDPAITQMNLTAFDLWIEVLKSKLDKLEEWFNALPHDEQDRIRPEYIQQRIILAWKEQEGEL